MKAKLYGAPLKTPVIRLKTAYSYVIKVADSEYSEQLGLCNVSLIVELFAFFRIRLTITITIENYSTAILGIPYFILTIYSFHALVQRSLRGLAQTP